VKISENIVSNNCKKNSDIKVSLSNWIFPCSWIKIHYKCGSKLWHELHFGWSWSL